MKLILVTLRAMLLCMIVPMCCQGPGSLGTELEQKARAIGLALLVNCGDEMGVYSFENAPMFRRFPSSFASPTATPDGMLIVWATHGPPYTSNIEIESVTGKITEVGKVDCWLRILALSSGSRPNVAFVSNMTELRYGDLAGSATNVIEGLEPFSQSAGWSPDGKKLVYGRQGQILLLDTTTHRSTVIDSGNDPTWSLNGRWIAYRSSRNQAILLDQKSGQKHVILERHELAPLPLRWSPDSAYLAYVERYAKDHTRWQLSVVRVNDEATIMVATFDPIRGYVTDWSWILRYRDFCRQCKPR